MAIVKMSKIRVLGLLDDKNKVYDYLCNNAKVHISKTYDYKDTFSNDNAKKVEENENLRKDIDSLIDFMESVFGEKEIIEVTKTELEGIKDNQEDVLEVIKSCMSLKNEYQKIKDSIEKEKNLIPILLANKDKLLSELKQNKIINIEIEKDCLASEKLSTIKQNIAQNEDKKKSLEEDICQYKQNLRQIKLYREHIALNEEKSKLDLLIKTTQTTFVLEFFTQKEEQEKVCDGLQKLSPTIISEQVKINDDELPPTLLKNGKLTKQAEFVTDMYSTPSYKERDPNLLVFWFFMIFFGYIMADIGLGITLIFAGLFLSKKSEKGSGAQKLWSLITTGGVFTIVWGILYNSMFGFSVLPFTIMPNPSEQAILTLLICLLMGVIHIACGYFMSGLNAIKQQKIVSAIFDCFMWDVFFIGFLMAGTKFLLDFFSLIDKSSMLAEILAFIQLPGLILMLTSLLIIIVMSARHGKGVFGKAIKAFSSAYGLINLFSDILSYARLFGLMLSGAIIGQQFDQIGLGLMSGGSILGIVFGIVVIVIGNAFNLAMGALGAYIHDCRLQYIEYFGKFYTGEGMPFKAFSPKYKYITIKSED